MIGRFSYKMKNILEEDRTVWSWRSLGAALLGCKSWLQLLCTVGIHSFILIEASNTKQFSCCWLMKSKQNLGFFLFVSLNPTQNNFDVVGWWNLSKKFGLFFSQPNTYKNFDVVGWWNLSKKFGFLSLCFSQPTTSISHSLWLKIWVFFF